MKKLFAFSLLAAALMFVACGEKQEPAAPAEEVVEAIAVEEAPAPVVIEEAPAVTEEAPAIEEVAEEVVSTEEVSQ